MKSQLLLLLTPFLATASPVVPRAEESLDKLYKGVGKIYFGTIAEKGKLQTGQNANIIQSRFGQVTPEYSMKWEAIEPKRGEFNFGDPEYLVKWAGENGKSIRGHALIWHQALPGWVDAINDRATLTSVIENHISTVVGRWKGKIRAWDVVNEIFNTDGTLRPSVFSRVLGEDFVGIAFHAARKADPEAKLYINEYDLDNEGWPKIPAIVNKVKLWKSKGIPIDGIGSQTHLKSGMSGAIESALRALVEAGVEEVAVTELDIVNGTPQDWRDVVKACYYVPKCVGVTTWGIRDADSWQPGKNSLMFNNDYAPTDSYYATRDYLGSIQK